MVLILKDKLPMRLEISDMHIHAKTFKLLALLIMPILMLQACGSTQDSNVDTKHQDRLVTNANLETEDGNRNYHLYLPRSPDNAPIVLLLHGHSGSGDQILGLNGVVSPFRL